MLFADADAPTLSVFEDGGCQSPAQSSGQKIVQVLPSYQSFRASRVIGRVGHARNGRGDSSPPHFTGQNGQKPYSIAWIGEISQNVDVAGNSGSSPYAGQGTRCQPFRLSSRITCSPAGIAMIVRESRGPCFMRSIVASSRRRCEGRRIDWSVGGSKGPGRRWSKRRRVCRSEGWRRHRCGRWAWCPGCSWCNGRSERRCG